MTLAVNMLAPAEVEVRSGANAGAAPRLHIEACLRGTLRTNAATVRGPLRQRGEVSP